MSLATDWNTFDESVAEPELDKSKATINWPAVPVGTIVMAKDRNNFGDVVEDKGADCEVHFKSEEGRDFTRWFSKSELCYQDGTPLDPSAETPLPSIVSLVSLVAQYPKLRPPVVHKLLRRGETANVIAGPKVGKSWLVAELALSVARGDPWLETFDCERGKVLIIDAELHSETIAHRLPMVAEAMGMEREILSSIDILPLRGVGADLLKLNSRLAEIEPKKYALVVLDAWYRFLPLGISENDNAQVMSLYNKIDEYASRLEAAWVNVHHASKGDQTGKGVTDVGSGAGSQSRAADAHLIIRPHAQDGVAVLEAVVRSFPPVDPLAIRFHFPVWTLEREADPRDLQKPREKFARETKDRHLDADRQAIVNAMVAAKGPETMTAIRNTARVSNPRFGFAWASLLGDKTIAQCEEDIVKGNGRSYEAFVVTEEGKQATKTATG
ncbi:MAG: AAA family ATPase [Thermoguttaceae bacterium]